MTQSTSVSNQNSNCLKTVIGMTQSTSASNQTSHDNFRVSFFLRVRQSILHLKTACKQNTKTEFLALCYVSFRVCDQYGRYLKTVGASEVCFTEDEAKYCHSFNSVNRQIFQLTTS